MLKIKIKKKYCTGEKNSGSYWCSMATLFHPKYFMKAAFALLYEVVDGAARYVFGYVLLLSNFGEPDA